VKLIFYKSNLIEKIEEKENKESKWKYERVLLISNKIKKFKIN